MYNKALIFLFAAFNAKFSLGNNEEHRKDASISPETNDERRNLANSYSPKPKMVAQEVIPGSDFTAATNRVRSPDDEMVQSKAAIFTGTCSVSSPFEFIVGGKVGRGVIGAPSILGSDFLASVVTALEISDQNKNGKLSVLDDEIFPDFFSGLGSSDNQSPGSFVGLPFKYKGMRDIEGTMLKVSCAGQHEPVDIVVYVEDRMSKVVEASVTHDPFFDEQVVTLTGGVVSEKDIYIEPIAPKRVGLPLKVGAVSGSATAESITLFKKEVREVPTMSENSIPSDSTVESDVTLVQLKVKDNDGFLVPKTLPISTKHRPENKRRRLKEGIVNTINVKHFYIDGNGDLAFKFEQLGDGEKENSLLHARIGISSQCSDKDNGAVKHIVDMKAMLSGKEPTIIVHGGWFRRATKQHDINNCNWEPVLVDAVAEDPEDNYIMIGRLETSVHAKVLIEDDTSRSGGLRRLSSAELSNRRKLLRAMPSSEEININEDMRQGRKPEDKYDGGRGLQLDLSKKILVHGYCSGAGQIDANHFTDKVVFADHYQNRSNDQFARLIDSFANQQHLRSCGVIAHSQGGTAALHLYTYYFSCLDYASNGGTRLIQTVGSPYGGSPMAGTLASIGYAFGASCGSNSDMTTSGAASWLSSIPYSSRSSVYFRTTSVASDGKWWTWDACHRGTDLLLSDPDDGAIEKQKGQLPGGNNLGHTKGLCHTTDMNNPAQVRNAPINSNMNDNAKF